jgi:hypothetical protein
LHNGWFNDLNLRLSEVAKKLGSAPERFGDDPPSDDVVAGGGEVSAADADLDEDGEDTTLDHDGRHSARTFGRRPEKGDI